MSIIEIKLERSQNEDVVIKIIDKSTEHVECYGIALKVDDEVKSTPTYPFVSREADKPQLMEFLEIYGEKLAEFYLAGNRLDFGNYILYCDTEAKKRFRDYWFSKGVLIY